MDIKIALAGNPNSGKTTLFNALTGSNQFVGNWPGVTVEKKEGKLKKHEGVIVTDLPGIYSLSPYTLEEVVARNYLIGERPDAILNIVDGTNLERNLYLTTQLIEIGIPVVIAINMMDVVNKNGDLIDIEKLSRALGCQVVEISALKETGINEAAEAAIEAAKNGRTMPPHIFSGEVEHAIAHIEEAAIHDLPEDEQRFYAIKIFERDEKVLESLKIPEEILGHIEKDIRAAEEKLDDDAEGIITNERYVYVSDIIRKSYKKKNVGGLSTSEKIDKVMTNRFLALPIFALIMFLVYFISVTTVGAWVTDFTNDGLFGDGFHLFGIDGAYEEEVEEYGEAAELVEGYISSSGLGADADRDALNGSILLLPDNHEFTYVQVNEEDLSESEVTATVGELKEAMTVYYDEYKATEPDPAELSPKTGEKYGVWVPGVPVLVEKGLSSFDCPAWLSGLILDGIVAGVGGVLGFVPQILVLFLILAFLEACGYMSRIAFVLDRIFRKFGLSGKSFIPMLVGTGCGVPGIMASRTIENERDRRMTIITTTFIPCGAKLPFIAMIAGAVFGGAWWVAPVAYFLGMFAIIVSGIILKKTRLFTGDPSPFVMELPAYHMPTLGNVLHSTWERGWSFIKKAGTVILLSTVLIWFTTYFGFIDGSFRMLTDEQVDHSILATVGKFVAWIFAPLGFGNWQAAVASVTGLVAKENIVASMSVVYGDIHGIGAAFTKASGMAFLIFNLLCAPCFAAMGAIRREMNNWKWTAFAITYQCVFAYAIAFIAYYLMLLLTGSFVATVTNFVCLGIAALLLGLLIFLIVRPASKRKAPKTKAKA